MACSSSGSSVFLPEVGGTDTPAADGVAEVAPEIPRAEETEAGADLPDLGFDETEALVLCQPGDCCFGDKCTQNEQCASGWCVDKMGEGVCTQLCQDECPDGWSCKQLLGTAPDFVFACVSDYSNLCRPCQDGNDCKSPDGTEDVCLDYEESGSFCGGACGATKECPWGFSCKPALTVDGIATTRCVADTGECPCTAKSVALSLWTPCRQTSAWGTCAGKRVCTADGLLPCDAPLPAEEACNGLDDDCDGETDEATCDDGNACTDDACLGTDGCQHEPLSGG